MISEMVSLAQDIRKDPRFARHASSYPTSSRFQQEHLALIYLAGLIHGDLNQEMYDAGYSLPPEFLSHALRIYKLTLSTRNTSLRVDHVPPSSE